MNLQTPISHDLFSLLSNACQKIKDPFSEHTVGNLFLYRKVHEYIALQKNDELLIKGVTYDKISFIMPLTNFYDENSLIQIAHDANVQMIYPIDESFWSRFQELGCTINWTPSDSDYMYSRHAIQTLSGRILAKKKNLYSQFTNTTNWKILPLDELSFLDAYEFLNLWYKERPDSEDMEAMYDGLRFFEELHLLGWIIYIDNIPVGLYYGEVQAPSTFIVHCAKALPNIKGLGAFIQIEATKNLPTFLTNLNWEQDLGLAGLRQSKYTFQPSLIRKKGRIIL